jgi:hypothetical protein
MAVMEQKSRKRGLDWYRQGYVIVSVSISFSEQLLRLEGRCMSVGLGRG